MKKLSEKEIKDYKPEQFYKDKNGNIIPYLKKDLWNEIDVYKPDTFLPFLEEFDFPFIENEWLMIIQSQIWHQKPINTKAILGRYIAKMKLAGYKRLGFKESIYCKDEKILAYQPEVIFQKITPEYLERHSIDGEQMTYKYHHYAFWL